MELKASLLIITAISMVSLAYTGFLVTDEADGLPPGYPVYLSGGYAVEIENETAYIDYLQPGTTENYLIHLYNDGQEQVRYRISITDSPEEWLVFLRNGIQETIVDLDSGATKAIDLNMKVPVELTGNIDLLVSDESTDQEWELSLRIICQSGPLLVSVPGSSYIMGRETPSEFDLELTNIGNTVLNVSLTMDGIVSSTSRLEGTWTVVFSRRQVFVDPGTTEIVRATVWCPELEPKGSQKVSSIVATVEGITRPFETGSLSFKVQTIFDLRSSVLPIDYQDVQPGGQVEFVISIENWADDYDTVSIDIFEKPSGWDIVFNDTIDPTSVPITVDPEGERSFHPMVMVPRNAFAGEQLVRLQAKGTTNTTMIDLKVRVDREDLFTLSSVTSSGSEDTYRITVGENLLPFRLVNKGNFYDTVTLEIETSPSWSTLSFHSVVVGSGDNSTTLPALSGINISGERDREIVFQEDPLTVLSLSFDPGQTATVYLGTDISLGATAQSGVVGIKYSYGVFKEQRFLQSSLKLILADIAIVDLDGDGTPDLEVSPEPDYKVGDRITFNWVLRNDYPYESSGLRWSIELSGNTLLEGDVGTIAPGETKEFNATWESDKSTNLRNKAILRITGDVFPSEERSPSAMSDADIYIEPGKGTPPWGLMILFAGFMLIVIGGFIAFFIWVRRDLAEKEAEERERYESLYGKADRPGLKGDRGSSRRIGSLSSGRMPGLPASSEPGKKMRKEEEEKVDRRKPRSKRRPDRRKEKAGSLGEMEGGMTAKKKRPPGKRTVEAGKDQRQEKKRKRSGRKKKSSSARKKKEEDEIGELEEMEELEEL